METKTIEEKKIKFLQFSILSPEEIQRISVVEVESDLTFENNMPKIGGLMDQRLGAIDRDFYCTTDYASFIECPGYFGHIKLNKPVFHEGYMGFILLILRCVDHKTSKLVMNPENRKIKNILKIRNPYQRLTKIAKLSTSACLSHKNRKISDNNFTKEEIPIQPKYSKDGWCIIANFDKSLTSEPTRILTAERIHEICSNISDEDCKKLGLNPKLARPDWMILTILPIPPPSIRPSVMFDLTSRAEDDLTYKLGDIIRTNKSLFQMIASFAPPLIINEQINLLQYHIGSYMNNNVPNLAKSIQRSGRAIKSLKQRLQGKEGRIRGNLMGKRVDFSARTVITPDPNLSLDEIGVPWSIALNLTYPEIVTKFNLDSIKKIVSNGPLCHPGAKYIIRNDGSRIDLRFVKNISEIDLEVGFQVERHLQDGDVVLFNRQPSLHKMSMMGHVVKIMHYSTFRMNLSATSPYNADFDGDEMNLHLPQTIEAKAELLHLLMVPKCIISQQGNKPVIGIVQDSLLGSLLLTQRDTFLNRSKFFQILMQVDEKNFTLPPPSILKPQILWSGKQVVSLVIPNISLRRVCLSHPENEKSKISPGDTRLLIKKGILLTGMIDKRAIGSSAGSIIHICYREFGPERTTLFISQFQLIVNCWLSMNGFSVGIGDAIADGKTILDVANTIKQAKTKVAEVNKKIDPSKLIIDSEKLNQESFETQVNKILNNARDKAGSNAQKFLSNSNNIKRMVISGSKGSFINLSQIIACVGQQNVEGKRIPLGFNSRTLPHFGKKNKDPETRGFVQNSYISGLLPSEFFFHSMGGREGLIDTAIKTSETGYIQRRLSKAMEDITVEYDLTVRNGQNGIIEFFYGEDSLDASNLENQKLFLLKLTEREIETVFRFSTSSPCFGLDKKANTINEGTKNKDQKIDFLLEEEFAQINRDREILKQLLLSSEENVATLPVNFDRLVLSAQNIFEISRQEENLITPYEVIQGLKKTEEYCMKLLGLESTGKNFKQDPENFLNATLLFRVYLRATLASKIVIVQYTLTKKAFQWILGEICTQFRKAIVSPGEMVGVIAAQSIGQPATQMTLNTFHYAGVSAKNVTLGVPRLKELINVLKIVKTPSLTIYLNKDCSTSAFRVKRLKQALEFTSLKNVLKKTQFFYDPDPFKTIVNKDRNIMEDFFGFPEETLDLKHLGSWVMKVAIQTEEFVDKKLSSDQFIEKIQKKIKPLPLFIMSSDENSGEIIFRFKIFWPNLFREKNFSAKPISFSKSLPTFERQFLNRMSHFMNGVNLKDYGTSKIKKIFIRKTNLLTPLFSNKKHSLVKKEYVLDTEGVDLRYILNYTGVDFTRSLSNDIIETFKILGIEASRKVLIQELKNLISFDGSYVNSRHLSLLVDIMTHRGKLMSITRHGINKTDIGPIAKCSFEETVDVLYQSAVFGVSDNLKGVSSSILIGQSPKIGTGKIDLFLSEKFLKKISK